MNIWLELSLLLLPTGTLWSLQAASLSASRQRALWVSGIYLGLVLLAWLDFHHFQMQFSVLPVLQQWLSADALSLSALLLNAVLGLSLMGMTLKTRRKRFSFARTLLLQNLAQLALLAQPVCLLLLLLCLIQLTLVHELQQRGRAYRLQSLYTCLFAVLVSVGIFWMPLQPEAGHLMLLTGLWLYSGLPPFQTGVLDRFDRAALGSALLTTHTLIGVYALLRLTGPHLSNQAQTGITCLALLGSLYCAGQACTQKKGRRFLAYFSLSHQGLIVAALLSVHSLSQWAGFSLWFSTSLSLMGLGLIFRALEARKGRLDLDRFWGLARQTPVLSALFLLMALSATGFPGSPGFWGLEILLTATGHQHPLLGLLVLLSASLNSIAAVRAYYQLFLGAAPETTLRLNIRRAELLALLLPLLLLLHQAAAPQWLLNYSQQLYPQQHNSHQASSRTSP